MDVASLKAAPMRWMTESFRCEVLGTHPFFGPGVKSLHGETVYVCRGRSGFYTEWMLGLLSDSGAAVSETAPGDHDRLMTLAQVLRQMILLTAARAVDLAGHDIQVYRDQVPGMMGAILEMASSQSLENPELLEDMWFMNPESGRMAQYLARAAREITGALLSGDRMQVRTSLALARRCLHGLSEGSGEGDRYEPIVHARPDSGSSGGGDGSRDVFRIGAEEVPE